MSNFVIEVDSALCEVKVLTERAKVMIENVGQGYFNQDVKTDNGQTSTLAYYDTAGIKMDITNDIVYNLLNQLKELRALIDKAGKAGAAV